MRLYIRACNAGSKTACDNAGQNYLSGLGVAKDEALGLTYLERACFGGRFVACLEGDSDAEMKRNASRHLRMASFACSAGRAGACNEAADAYAPGGYASPDPGKAAEFRAKACALSRSACKK
jgi:TPR repeat protein